MAARTAGVSRAAPPPLPPPFAASAPGVAAAASSAASSAALSPIADEGEEEVEGTAPRSVGGAMLEGADEEDGCEGRGAKNAATLTRGAATPSGAFKLKELIVRSRFFIFYLVIDCSNC